MSFPFQYQRQRVCDNWLPQTATTTSPFEQAWGWDTLEEDWQSGFRGGAPWLSNADQKPDPIANFRTRWVLFLYKNLLAKICLPSNYSIIRVTLNTKLDTPCFVKVGGPTNKYDTSPESWIPGAVPGVGFMLIALLLCLQPQFEKCTFCRAEYSEYLPFDKN